MGDVNIDYSVDVVDLTNQIGFILDFHSPSQYQFWASDMNEDNLLNIEDIVSLLDNIVNLSRSNNNSEAYIKNNHLHIDGDVSGMQFTGTLNSYLNGDDLIISNDQNKTLVYNLNGQLKTKSFNFKNIPRDLLLVSSSGEIIDIKYNNSEKFSLVSAYPNPFNPTTTINYSLEKNENIKINIYNINGSLVDNIFNGFQSIGTHQVVWNAKDYPSGIYFVKMSSISSSKTYKVVLAK